MEQEKQPPKCRSKDFKFKFQRPPGIWAAMCSEREFNVKRLHLLQVYTEWEQNCGREWEEQFGWSNGRALQQ